MPENATGKLLTVEQELELIEEYKLGKSYKKLAKQFNIGSTTARSIVHRHGIETRISYGKHRRLLTPEQESEIAELYLSGKNAPEIALIFNVTHQIIVDTVNRKGIEMRKPGGYRKLTDEQESEICIKYKNGCSLAYLGCLYDIHATSILGILERHGISRRQTKEIQHYVNDSFFDDLSSEYPAYFFGLLYADGNVKDSKYPTISISLQECDKPLLERLNNIVENERSLYMQNRDDNPNHKDQYILLMYSYHMRDVLVSYGMVPCKSLIKKFPKVVLESSEDVQRNFIRGYFDGNGTIGYYQRSNRKKGQFVYVAAIVSTYAVVYNIQLLLTKYLNIASYIHRQKNVHVVKINNKKDVITFMQWLYKDSTIYMERKYKKYLEICNL